MASLTSQAEEIPIIVMLKAHGRGACAAHVYVTRHAQATELAGSPYQRAESIVYAMRPTEPLKVCTEYPVYILVVESL